MRRIGGLVLALVLGIADNGSNGYAYDQATHMLINRAAADTPAFDAVLRTRLGLIRELQESFAGKTVLQRIEDGGDFEDQGTRFLRHFHGPLEPWDQAGLRLVFVQHESSILWMQRSIGTIRSGRPETWAGRLYGSIMRPR